jgi:chorismate synthase
LGAVVDGMPPGIEISTDYIQAFLDQRRPGTSRHVTQRREPDAVEILSGVFEGKSTGTPIALEIKNQDARSKDYGDIASKFRPGHADYAYMAKYGIRDYRGGGRQSARETAARVAAGALARLALHHVLGPDISIRAALVQMGPHAIDRARFDWDEVSRNPFFCPDAERAAFYDSYLDELRKNGSSVGAVIEVTASGVPAGLGAPLYAKLDGDLAAAMMSINAVKAVEIGAGFAAASFEGAENADEMRRGPNGAPIFSSNHAGGISGGISTGQDIVLRFAVKPTSSILTPRLTIDERGQETEIVTKGRHDPCVGIRAVPVGEAMMALVLADHALRHRGQVGPAPYWQPGD